MNLIDAMRQKDTLTENLMPTHSTSLDRCVDFFGSVGSARNWSDEQIESAFVRAIEQEPLVAMKILFWARDVRGGAGERRVFRVITKYMDSNPHYKEILYKNLYLIPEYGRWDDVFTLTDLKVFELIKKGLDEGNGLLAKWLPRKGSFANTIRGYLGLTPKAYRKLIVGLSATVEQHMCAKDWRSIKYESVPSVAMNKYRKAFKRNDTERFEEFIEAVISGETEIKSGVLFPYQLYQAYNRREDAKAIEAQWMNLPNYMEDNPHMIIPMCDTSGSMTCCYGNRVNASLTPMDISVSLGIYISERNEGPFKDAFLTFSGRPKLQYLKGSFTARCKQLEKAEWSMNTNLEAAFGLLLSTAIRESIPKDHMPNMILIISDMQFDYCVKNPNELALEMIKHRYVESGYDFPKVIFWNVNARVEQMPVSYKDKNTGIVSGCSPAILTSILSGENLTPRDLMLRTINKPRYASIEV